MSGMLAGPALRREMERERLGTWLQRELGETLEAMVAVAGGCIHGAWRLELSSGRRLFAKYNRAALLPVLAAEAEGLNALSAVVATTVAPPGLTVPTPLHLTELEGEALLVLPWLELSRQPPASERAWQQLGSQLAGLHLASLQGHDGRFGWHEDNWIGAAPQHNGWDEDWGRFFTERRLRPQLERAAQRGQPLQGAAALLERLPHWLREHRVEACLVHGDLWSGNAGLLRDGGGALFDPAVYRGDREVDLAMAKLFGGFPAAFFTGYETAWPLAPGHRQRREAYNLYHLLNHANLFGGGYQAQAERSLQALLRIMSA
jgi:fructosamine-3-kinase